MQNVIDQCLRLNSLVNSVPGDCVNCTEEYITLIIRLSDVLENEYRGPAAMNKIKGKITNWIKNHRHCSSELGSLKDRIERLKKKTGQLSENDEKTLMLLQKKSADRSPTENSTFQQLSEELWQDRLRVSSAYAHTSFIDICPLLRSVCVLF